MWKKQGTCRVVWEPGKQTKKKKDWESGWHSSEKIHLFLQVCVLIRPSVHNNDKDNGVYCMLSVWLNWRCKWIISLVSLVWRKTKKPVEIFTATTTVTKIKTKKYYSLLFSLLSLYTAIIIQTIASDKKDQKILYILYRVCLHTIHILHHPTFLNFFCSIFFLFFALFLAQRFISGILSDKSLWSCWGEKGRFFRSAFCCN